MLGVVVLEQNEADGWGRAVSQGRIVWITIGSALVGAAAEAYTSGEFAAPLAAIGGGLGAAYLLSNQGETRSHAARVGAIVALCAYVLSFPGVLFVAWVSLLVLALFGHSI